jgi:hypothetical protein
MITVTYQWVRDGKPIAHATARTYKLTKRDRKHRIACRITASNLAGRVAFTTPTSRRVK